MQLVPGLVIAIADGRVRPRHRRKWHICVSPEQRLFLRINSKPLWPPSHPIKAEQNSFLEHDSYVELTTLHFFPESELRRATRVGQMSEIEQTNLAYAAVETGVTLRADHKEIIWEKLGGLP